MKAYHTKQLTWFPEDEGLLSIVKGLAHPGCQRRSYGVHECAGRKVFIKTFGEKGAAGHIR